MGPQAPGVYDFPTLILIPRKKNMHETISATGATVLAGCASPPGIGNVIPAAGGHYPIIGVDSSSAIAMKPALCTAETTCKPLCMHRIVTGQQTLYRGAHSESANRPASSVTDAAASLTHIWIPSLSTDDDYQITLSLTCEA